MSDPQTIPYGYCHCGCGEKTSLAKADREEYGHVKGEPVRYRVGHAQRRPVSERFWEKVERTEGGCWLWRGSVHSETGYGSFSSGARSGVSVIAHRAAYELAVGTIPGGFDIHHRCRNRACVNPDHLEAVDRAAHKAAHLKTHCKYGHEFTPENTYITKAGTRSCRACARKYQRDLKASRRVPKEPIQCRVCGRVFLPGRTTQRNCSHECAAEFARRRVAAKRASLTA